MLRLTLTLTLIGCYSPDLSDCAVTCAADSECGGGQICAAGMCAREGIDCSVAPGVDAVASIVDAGTEPDAPINPDANPDGPPPPPPPDAPPATTTLRVKIKDQGRVTPNGFAPCTTGECTYQVPIGQSITLTAVPNANRIFEKWEEACTGQLLPICTLTPTGTTNVTGKFKKPGNNDEDD